MSHSYSLYDGSTTISLTSGVTCITTDFTPTTAEPNATEDITDTIGVMFLGASGSAVQTNIRAVNTMLQAATRRDSTRIYLQVQLDSDSSTWRTRITNGKVDLNEGALATWGNFKVEAKIHVTHAPFWEGPRTEIQLASATSTTPATGGKAITNAANCWVQIVSSQVGGDLPTPIELSLTNTTGSGVDYRNFYLANNAFCDPTNFVAILEGEARSSGGSTAALAGTSGGSYNSSVLGSAGSTEVLWSLSSAQMQRTLGRRFRILARMVGWSTANEIYLTMILRDSNGLMTLAESDEVKLGTSGSQILDLGELPLPAGGYQASWGAQVLSMSIRATGAATLNHDFFQLTPLDSYQVIAQRGYTVANSGVITFDNIENLFHYAGNPIYSPRSGSLQVYPGVTQRIYILNDEGTSSNITRAFTVRAYIRERRVTI